MSYQTSLPFETKWIQNVSINVNAVRYQASILRQERDCSLDDRIKLTLLALRCVDLTTLAGDDSCSNVKRLCARSQQPLRKELTQRLINLGHVEKVKDLSVAAVCFYPFNLSFALNAFQHLNGEMNNRTVAIAVVSTGFPSGQLSDIGLRCKEISQAIRNGAEEVDVVIVRSLVLMGEWEKLYEEIASMRRACGQKAKLKVIIEVGELGSLENVFKASIVAMNAGADFIKTSTGKATVNATLMFGIVMLRAIWAFKSYTGRTIGFKAAGGIKSTKDSLDWLELVRVELGNEWLSPKLFRIGASSLVTELEKDLFREMFKRMPTTSEISL